MDCGSRDFALLGVSTPAVYFLTALLFGIGVYTLVRDEARFSAFDSGALIALLLCPGLIIGPSTMLAVGIVGLSRRFGS
ncbi:MAG: hypothetical protein OK404_00845 [Thaumarchaeota archaeon]|nr:hypothetical protein [Nitrososphaerota archaeon]